MTSWKPWFAGIAGLAAVAGFCALALAELRTSRLQSTLWSEIAGAARFAVEPGASEAVRYPAAGPYDMRLGYHALAERIGRLEAGGFAVTEQARMSPQMLELAAQGLFVPYREKNQAGLSLRDCRGETLLRVREPQRIYEDFDAVPALLVDALLFIEDRHLLDPRQPRRNPAIDPERFARAGFEQLQRFADPGRSAAGGSTLATQIEKYRHSPGGRTESVAAKLRQMASASLRAYRDGPETLAQRRRIVVDYLNTVPLAARAGIGEVHGIGDGLWAWYGRDFGDVNRLLGGSAADNGDAPAPSGEALDAQALAFKQALSLLIAQRRPARHLAGDGAALQSLTDSYLRLMAEAKLIAPALRDAALAQPLRVHAPPPLARPDFVQRKAASALRTELSARLEMPRAYDVERLDLEADATLDGRAQQFAAQRLAELKTPAAAKAAGLVGSHMLAAGADPSRLVFSLTLYERGERANRLRVQADSVDQPFDVNRGARLDLGSTAKLRTLVGYLEAVAELHARWVGLDPQQLAALPVSGRDPLSVWARQYLSHAVDRRLAEMLDAAMQRRYSASPAEAFFTGGGLHRFENFDPTHNRRAMTVGEGFTHSVNLVFIRLMRDLVAHRMYGDSPDRALIVTDRADPRRRELLERFADREGAAFLTRFYRKYQGRSAADAQALLLREVRPSAAALAAALLTVDPQASDARLAEWLSGLPRRANVSARELNSLREGSARLSLADRGYLARVHPLELWLVGHLREHPAASLAEVVEASRSQRQEAYGWLFKTRHPAAQDSRIRAMLELDAFAHIHRSWRRLGYPFETLTPSYASAIGASGDRPAALAELIGIIGGGGERRAMQSLTAIRLARETPYETRLAPRAAEPVQVLAPEVAATLERALADVVESGTARRLKGALHDAQGRPIAIAGKTGTGDHRVELSGRGGRRIADRVIERTATFVFSLGPRYFGTVVAYVQEPDAARHRFTSALPVQLLKSIAPPLLALLEADACGGAQAGALAARP